MSDSSGGSNIVVETTQRILRDRCTPALVNEAERGEFPAALWETLEESGLTLAWVPDEFGGAGAEIADGFGALRAAGEHALPLPLAETMMAGFLLARAGIACPAGPMTVAPVHAADAVQVGADGTLQGSARLVPFARWAGHLAVPARRGGEACVALVALADCAVKPGQSLAGEPRDGVVLHGVRPLELAAAPGLDADALGVLGAAVRAVQMAGGLERTLNMALEHAVTRVQFGRPIGGFQVIQHALAQFAGESAAAGAAADAAAEAIAAGAALTDAEVVAEVAAAKIRVGEAAGVGAAIAHQVHGAMGFTYELSLHQVTRRLWTWRDEFGGEAAWSIRLGGIAARAGADALWPLVTGTH
ncbi:MAG: acyl-CoA/acyl-ACP dehydrogenase [Acetobacteraceae bacterium]|nr:acyl-CoA/acyl-ACP dehydrogenase [Acetobacteraceae bacterium]